MDSYVVDASGFLGKADKVLVPAGEPELLEILHDAVRKSIPVTISGGRTGLTGGSVAQGGWIISLEKFQRLEISTDCGLRRVPRHLALSKMSAAAEAARRLRETG